MRGRVGRNFFILLNFYFWVNRRGFYVRSLEVVLKNFFNFFIVVGGFCVYGWKFIYFRFSCGKYFNKIRG